jgi:glucose/arabinose dehydrogenase
MLNVLRLRRGRAGLALSATLLGLALAVSCPRAGVGTVPAGGAKLNAAITGAVEEPQITAQTQAADHNPRALPLSNIKLPPGFSISVYAADVPSARELSLSPGGVLYVGSNAAGSVYAVLDNDHDYYADEVVSIAKNKWLPVGVCYHDGDLYFSEVDSVWRFADIEAHLKQPKQAELIARFPDKKHHGWKFIRFGPDGKLYVPVGMPCNVCEAQDPFGAILRMDADGGNREIVARGMRNTVGFDWQPGSNAMYWTDNGRDLLGDDIPPDELNRIPPGSGTGKDAPNFGFPYWHGKSIPDPELGKGRSAAEFTLPVRELGPHVAALGMRFYTGSMFPAEYKGAIFIAEHGSWNRTHKIGYRIMLVKLDGAGNALSYSVFAEGWLQLGEKVWGRPADVEQMPDGSLLVSDDHAGCVYRITYK